jgi:two-component system cell cycle response regulator
LHRRVCFRLSIRHLLMALTFRVDGGLMRRSLREHVHDPWFGTVRGSGSADVRIPGSRWRSRAGSRGRWVPMAVGMGALLLVYAGWQLLRWPAVDRSLIGDVFFYPVGLAASWAAVGASRRCAGQPRLRSAWRLLAVAAIVYLAGDIAQTIYETQGPDPFPSFADALYLSFYPLMLWGLLRFPAGRRDRRAWVRLMLDLAVVAIGGAMVVTYVVLGPTLREGGADALTNGVSIAYPVGDMILLVGLGSVLLRRTAVSSARALQFMVVGLLFFVAADLVYGYIQLHSTYQGGDSVDSLWMIAIALFAVAGAAQSSPGSTAVVAEGGRRTASWAPYVAVVVGFGLLIIDHRDLSLVIAGVLLATLVSVRQFLAQSDLVQMQRLATYESLHDALTGLPNRRWLIDDLRDALATSTREGPRTLAMFDLDGFKTYNDTFGHLAGDQLLVRLGERLQEFVAPHGRAYRLGGDEFCVLLDGVGVQLAQVVAGSAEALSETGTGFSIGASYGMVTIPSEADDVSAALHIADTRMYAKKNGRRAATIMAQTRDVLLGAAAEHSAGLPDHMLEVGELSRNVARRLGLDAEMVDLTLRAGELHDVGKLAIPESILSKPASLSDGEWAFVRNHTLIGERVLNAAPALQPVAKVVRSTHERFDGAGYPDGLSGEQIPLPSRIVFACEAFDAMISSRPYAPGMSVTDARAELRRCAGSQFDPRVIDALLAELDHRTPKPPPAGSVADPAPTSCSRGSATEPVSEVLFREMIREGW